MRHVAALPVLLLALAVACDSDVTSTSGGGGESSGTSSAVTATAAGPGSTASTGPAPYQIAVGDLAPDFSLVDVNPSSPTSLEFVSPRDHLGRVSAWYFGHST